MKSINRLCQLFSGFDSSLTRKEDLRSLYLEGAFSDGLEQLNSLARFVIEGEQSFANHITLIIDGENVPIEGFPEFCGNNPFSAEFGLTVDTKELAQSVFSGSCDVDEYLFTSVKALENNFQSLGVSSPLLESKINQLSNTRIHVFGLGDSFGGPKLAVVPTSEPKYGDDWLQGSRLPSSEVLLKQVHVVTSERVKIEPRNYELSWGNIEQPIALSFKYAYAQHLWAALSSIYYSSEKVQFKGVKHIDASVAISNENAITTGWLSTLSDSVVWCYGVDDPSVPTQLFVDRLSLEYHDGSLLDLKHESIRNCLEQAQNNYKFVIAKRSDDYRKELKDIYSDIKSVTDKFTEKAASLSSELLKSLMAIAFVFTVGTMSKAIVNGELLHSKEGVLLFKIIGIYLVSSFVVRWLNASAELKVASKALDSWSKKLHNHISTLEVEKLIEQHTKWPKMFYLVSLALVTTVQATIALAAFYIEGVLWYLGL